MGIYDRDYIRRDGPGFLETITSRGLICKWLIIVNVICFVVQLVTRRTIVPPEFEGLIRIPGTSPFTEAFWLATDAVWQGQVWRLLTYAFLHDTVGISHILWNMLFLWWFGTEIEDIYGHSEFLAFYLLSALAGGVAYTLANLVGDRSIPCLGASGAIMALMVLCACHYPMKQIRLFFLLPVPIWLLALVYVGKDTIDLVNGAHSGVAVAAHLGGAAFGGFYYLYGSNGGRLLNLWPDWRGWQRRVNRPKLRLYREEEAAAPVSVAAGAESDEQLEAKADAVLAKIQQHGRESLTESEQQVLLKASELYKRRRS